MFVVLHAPAPGDNDNVFSSTSAYGPYNNVHDAKAIAELLIEEDGGDDRYVGVVKVMAYEINMNLES